MKNIDVLKHNFNYATGKGREDSVINKLELTSKKDLIDYIKGLLKDNIINIKFNNEVATNMIYEPNTKIEIKIVKS